MECYGTGDGAVYAAEVNREGFINKDPNVIVAAEGEAFTASVFKPVPDFAGEAEVAVVFARSVSEAFAVEREEGGVIVDEGCPRAALLQRHGVDLCTVVDGVVFVPHGEPVHAAGCARDGAVVCG